MGSEKVDGIIGAAMLMHRLLEGRPPLLRLVAVVGLVGLVSCGEKPQQHPTPAVQPTEAIVRLPIATPWPILQNKRHQRHQRHNGLNKRFLA